ncbi:hypothetical protein VNO77_20160 [Canavalia gladiata]|uniref:Uncharacterized protein n=1 Tax=Canavalia gladiata TaxID=3824 RepID=A0AAN9LSA4_CANGL
MYSKGGLQMELQTTVTRNTKAVESDLTIEDVLGLGRALEDVLTKGRYSGHNNARLGESRLIFPQTRVSFKASYLRSLTEPYPSAGFLKFLHGLKRAKR